MFSLEIFDPSPTMSTAVEERASRSSSSLHEKIDSEKAEGKPLAYKKPPFSVLTATSAGRHEQIIAIAEFDDPNIDKDAVRFGLHV